MQEHKGGRAVEHGFTLIEMLVVVVMLGILAVVVLVSVQGIDGRGQASACKTEVSTVNTATQAFYVRSTSSPSYPTGPTPADLGAQLKAARLLATGSPFPGATKGRPMNYDPATGVFTAAC